MELFGKYMSDLSPDKQDIVWAEFEQRVNK